MDDDWQVGESAVQQLESGIAQLAFSTEEFDFHFSPHYAEYIAVNILIRGIA